MNINIASININGLNTEKKKKMLHKFIIQHKLDIIYLQEHNLREDGKIQFLERFYDIILNKSVNMRGGTCIIIRKSLNCTIERVELSADSRIISTICRIQDKKIQLLNIYELSGNNLHAEREKLFEKELPYYMRHNIPNTLMGGDFNSVLS